MALGALTKPVQDLTAVEINELISSRAQEGESVEFKAGFSSIGSQNQSVVRDRITNDDQASLLKEIVAFANGYGGRLFVGVAERNGSPPEADMVTPIANCVDKADRLQRAFGNLIDPPMLRLDVVGIPTELDDSGVIVIDVPRSIRAPHMSKRDNRAYRRRGTESVPMDMRDIQDMTLRLVSRQSEIKEEFARCKKEFDAWADEFHSENEVGGYCLRLSFVPLDDVDLGQMHGNSNMRPEFINMVSEWKNTYTNKIPFSLIFVGYQDRPIVRGTSRWYEYPAQGISLVNYLRENGVLDVWFRCRIYSAIRENHVDVQLETLGGLLANGLRNVERVRRHAGLPSLTYGLEAQLRAFRGHGQSDYGGWRGFRQSLPVGDHVLPPFPIGRVDGFDGIVTQFITDWSNLAGSDWHGEITVDYKLG